MAFDSNRSRVVMFGGQTSPQPILVGDTWEWDGSNWTQADDIGPAPRMAFAMAYDRNRNRLVLFGGITANAASGETWEWDGQDWTQVSESGPQARSLHALAFDSSKNVVTLFGGQVAGNPQATMLNDTWEWDGQDWIQQEDTGPARCDHSMAYDDARKRLVLFGGNAGQGQDFGDTWEWDGTTWTQRSIFGPPPCSGLSLVYTGAECVLFGGNDDGVPQKQTWTWDGTHWTARQDIGPSARFGHGAAFDSVRGRVVLFGGQDQASNFFGDTWEQNATVGQGTDPVPPPVPVPTPPPVPVPTPPPAQGPPPELTMTGFAVSRIDGEEGATPTGQATVQLSGPAPANGAGITIVALPGSGVTLDQGMQATVPAGQTSLAIPLVANSATVGTVTATFSATLENGNSLQTTAQVVFEP